MAPSLDQLRPASRRERMVRIAAACAAAVLLCGFLDLSCFNYLEHYTYMARMAVYARCNASLAERARKQIVLVTLTDDSFLDLPGPPVPRRYHAKVLADLTRAGAKAVVFDLVFDLSGPDDKALAAAARASGKAVWACVLENQNTPDQRLLLPCAALRRAGPRWGHIMIPQDDDRPMVDRIRPAVMHDGQPVPALSVQAVRVALGLADQPLRRAGDHWSVGDLSIPTDTEGHFNISFVRSGRHAPGDESDAFPTVPYEHVAAGAVDDEFYRKSRFFEGKIVLVGDATTVGNDYRLTPVGLVAGMQIHAHAIATLLQRQFVRGAAPWLNTLVLCLVAAAVCLVVALLPLWRGVLAAAGLLVGYGVLNVLAFVGPGVWLHLVGPAAAAVGVTLGVLAERVVIEEREKKRFRGLLHRHVSPQIAEHIIAHPEACVLGGERVTATVLFSDIRGFTSLSEKLPPEQVVARLNEYFQVMTDIIFRHEGTVDKYVGDAIMALFGVPKPCADHARRAVATAIDMQVAIVRLRREWRTRGAALFDVGIGIGTGEMVVGNVGANERRDFTVIGDSVNLASRVEGLNKTMGSRILICEETFRAVEQDVWARGPLMAQVAGKQDPVAVYEVLGWREDAGEGVTSDQ